MDNEELGFESSSIALQSSSDVDSGSHSNDESEAEGNGWLIRKFIMSSRRGSRPSIGHHSEELQFVRRSSRERQMKYLSLAEDLILHESEQVQQYYSRSLGARNNNTSNSVGGKRNGATAKVNVTPNLSNAAGTYSLRSRFRRYQGDFDDSNAHGSDDEEPENRATISGATLRRSNRQAVKKSVSRATREEDTDGGEDDDLKDNSTSPSDSRDGFEETNAFEGTKSRASRRLAMIISDVPKSALSTPNEKRAAASKCGESKKVERECRRRRVEVLEEDVEEEEEDSEEKGPRVYSLRTNRSQSNFYGIEEPPPSSRSARQELHAKLCKLIPGRRSKTNLNTSPFRENDSSQPRRYNDDDKEREKTRSRFMPINFTEKDFAMRPLLNERLKTSTTFTHDGDSMALDQEMTFDKVGGLDGHIESLKEIVILPLLYPEVFSQFNISASKGVLFHGPPGTGKTLVARALANACSVNGRKIAFFMRKGADILSKWVGESEDQLRQLFEQAYQMRPAIIFFDEIDGLAPARSSKQDHIHTSIVSTLLALMDGLKNRGDVIVIGATNRVDAIDPALRRPGRFDRELKFSLPDNDARHAILKIHTSGWKSSISDEELRWLAENTPGYCGADLKFLCTEAFLSALRGEFPQIYVSNQKLQIDATKVVVKQHNFLSAMRRVVPACRRDFTVPIRQLNDRVGLLLRPMVEEIMSECIPSGYRNGNRLQGPEISKVEQVVKRFSGAKAVPPCRVLLAGKSEDMGQTSYVLPAVLNNLGHLAIFSLSLAKLYNNGTLEASFNEAIQQAISSSSRGTPAVLVVPAIDVWHQSVPLALWQLLHSALNSFSESTSVLFMATAGCCYDELPREVRDLFRLRQTREIGPPRDEYKTAYFNQVVVEPAMKMPDVFDPSIYPEIPIASETAPVHHYSKEDLDELKKNFDRDRNELSIHYIDTILRFIRDRRFGYFEVAVDPEEVPDYYDVIKEPMDLSTMLDKANFYKSPEDFLADFTLIRDNALEYNSHTSSEGRIIRQMAKALYHKGERAYHEIDSAFLRKLQETEKILLRNGVKLPGFDETTPEKVEEEPQPSCSSAPPNGAVAGRTSAKRRAAYLTFGKKRRRLNPSSKILKKYKRQTAKNSASSENIAESASEAVDLAAEETSGEDTENGPEEAPLGNDDERSEMNGKKSEPIETEESLAAASRLLINVEKLNAVVSKAVAKSKLWPLRELELLAGELSAKVDEFANKWNREELPNVLTNVINSWDFDAECSSREDED